MSQRSPTALPAAQSLARFARPDLPNGFVQSGTGDLRVVGDGSLTRGIWANTYKNQAGWETPADQGCVSGLADTKATEDRSDW